MIPEQDGNGDNQGRMNGNVAEWPSLALQIKWVDARLFCQLPDALVPIGVPPPLLQTSTPVPALKY